jgi:galactokinase
VTGPIVTRLIAAGMDPAAAARKEELFAQATDAMSDFTAPHGGEMRRFWVPGRIEFLGKHTDYAGGRSLLCAIERGICVVAAPRRDAELRVRDARTGETVKSALDPKIATRPGQWGNYPITVARRLARDFGASQPLVGADIAFASDLPAAAGISSSSALVVAIFLAIADVNALESRDDYRHAIRDREMLGGYLGAVENGLSFGDLPGDSGVGTFGGSEDHTAILCARTNALVQYSFCPVVFERAVAIPEGYTFLIASSGVTAAKTGAALALYNRVSTRSCEVLDVWNAASGRRDATLAAAVASSASAPDAIRAALATSASSAERARELTERFDQFVTECEEIIPAASNSLARGDLAQLGALVDRSMANAERQLHNQIDETVFLARRARELGAVAASAFGAGFGGSVWALVQANTADDIRTRLTADYVAQFPNRAKRAEVFATRAGPAAMRV